MRIEVEIQDATLMPRVERILPPGWRAVREFPEDGHLTLASRPGDLYDVLVDGHAAISGATASSALQVLDAQLRQDRHRSTGRRWPRPPVRKAVVSVPKATASEK